jgi:uncharacterized protein YndB with AHSA1/START domain
MEGSAERAAPPEKVAFPGTLSEENQMTTDAAGGARILGTLRDRDGRGVVRIEERFETGIDNLWSAITDPARLAQWHAQVEGDLRLGGEFHIYLESDDWEGTGRIEKCDPPGRLRVTTRESEQSWRKGQGAPPFDATIEATLTADGDGTLLVIEVRGLPLDPIAYYGVGWQIHAENLAAHLAGHDRGDTEARWDALLPAYQALAAEIGIESD